MKLLTVKRVTEDLLAAVVELDRLCFGGLWTKEAYQREIDSPKSSLLVLCYQEILEKTLTDNVAPRKYLPAKIIGIGCLWSIIDEAHITLLGIHPDRRGQKLGQFLLYLLLQDAIARQLKRATLEVNAHNQPAIALYQKFGFEIAGRRKNYYPTTGEDALVLWLKGLDTPEFTQKLFGWQKQINQSLNHHFWQIEKTNFYQ